MAGQFTNAVNMNTSKSSKAVVVGDVDFTVERDWFRIGQKFDEWLRLPSQAKLPNRVLEMWERIIKRY